MMHMRSLNVRSLKRKTKTVLAAFAAFVCGIFAAVQIFSFATFEISSANLILALSSCLLIILAHLFRVVRLSLLWPDGSFKTIFIGHSVSIAAGSTIPFKLGEIARFLIIGHLNGSLRSGLKAIWAERIADAVFILFAILGVVLAFGSLGTLQAQAAPILIVLGFLFLSGLVFLALPSTLVWARLLLLKSKEREYALMLMRATILLGTFIDRVPAILVSRFGPIVLLTTLIWSLEAIAIALSLSLARFDLLLTETTSTLSTAPDYLLTYLVARTMASLLMFFIGAVLMLRIRYQIKERQ